MGAGPEEHGPPRVHRHVGGGGCSHHGAALRAGGGRHLQTWIAVAGYGHGRQLRRRRDQGGDERDRRHQRQGWVPGQASDRGQLSRYPHQTRYRRPRGARLDLARKRPDDRRHLFERLRHGHPGNHPRAQDPASGAHQQQFQDRQRELHAFTPTSSAPTPRCSRGRWWWRWPR